MSAFGSGPFSFHTQLPNRHTSFREAQEQQVVLLLESNVQQHQPNSKRDVDWKNLPL